MTDHKLRTLVTAAVKLDRSIALLEEELKSIKKEIAAEAKTRRDEAASTDGGGTSIVFEGDDGCVARVTTAGATLKSSLKPDDKKLPKIKEAARGFFARLFDVETVYKPVANFREQAAELLGKDANKLVRLCESDGKTTVSFETKEVVKI
jgi:hypothetical protein